MTDTDKTMFRGARAPVFKNAFKLRKNLTYPEKLLWERLRRKQLGVRFKTQHPISNYIADFYCHQFKLVIEIDGLSHKNQLEYDENRTFKFESLGLTVVRYKNEEVLSDIEKVINDIKGRLVRF